MTKRREENEHVTFNLWSTLDLAYSLDNLIKLLWVDLLFSTKALEYRAFSKHSIYMNCRQLEENCQNASFMHKYVFQTTLSFMLFIVKLNGR